MEKIMIGLDRFFKLKERSTTVKKELIGGISTFFAMAYILAVNPGILSAANGASSYTSVFFIATVAASFAGTLFMGLYANVPLALAPGMGTNAFFAYTVAGPILRLQVEQALIGTLVSGLLYFIIAVTPLRMYIGRMLPKNFKLAIGAMIGLFLAYVGVNDSGIIVSDAFVGAGGSVISNTSTKLGNFADPFVIIAIVTMLLAFILHYLKVKGAVLIAMVCSIICLAILKGTGNVDASNAFKLQSYQQFSKFGELSSKMWTSFGSALSSPKIYIAIFVFLYIDFFDTTGTLFTIGEQAKLNTRDDKWLLRGNIVDATATMFGATMMTSTVTAYMESSVGVSQGSRTGLSSVFTSILFLLSIVIWPIMAPMLPISHIDAKVAAGHQTIMPVTGPILVLVGSLMISQLRYFEWKQTIDIPVLFIILIFGTLGFSISGGIAAGIIIYYLVNTAAWLSEKWHKMRNKPFSINDEEIIISKVNEKLENETPNLGKRIFNPVMITLFMLAVAYFATLPLYAY